jgi:hypothetical protein
MKIDQWEYLNVPKKEHATIGTWDTVPYYKSYTMAWETPGDAADSGDTAKKKLAIF